MRCCAMKDCRKLYGRRVKGQRRAGAPIQYTDGLTKSQRCRMRRKAKEESAPKSQQERLTKCIKVKSVKTKTLVATGSQVRACFGDEPPESLSDLALVVVDLQILTNLFTRVNDMFRDSSVSYCLVAGALLGLLVSNYNNKRLSAISPGLICIDRRCSLRPCRHE